MKQKWTPAEEARLRELYPGMPSADVATELGRTISQIHNKAFHLGLCKSPEFFASPASGRLDGVSRGLAQRFAKGITPWNAGMKGWQAGGKAAETQFRKGNKPQTWKPVGSERADKDGLLVRKVSDTGVKRTDWQPVHVVVWREHGNEIPPGHVVIFRDGNNRNFAIENLECVSRAELMRRNSITRFPPELRSAMTALRKFNKAIEASHEKQD